MVLFKRVLFEEIEEGPSQKVAKGRAHEKFGKTRVSGRLPVTSIQWKLTNKL